MDRWGLGRWRTAAAVVVAGVLALSACSSSGDSGDTTSASEGFPVTVTDAAGKKHTFDKPVTKIGCHWYYCYDVLADLGIRPQAGKPYTNSDGKVMFPLGQPVNDVESLGGSNSPESWAQSDVELIVARVHSDDRLKALESAGTIFSLSSPGDKGAVQTELAKKNLELVGQITGRQEQAKKAIARFDKFVADLKAKAPQDAATNAIVQLYNVGENYVMSSPTLPFCSIVADNGLGKCATSSDWNSGTYQINAEAFLKLDPQWIAYQGNGKSWKDRKDPIWPRLTAVKSGRVYDLPAGGEIDSVGLRSQQYFLHLYAFTVLKNASDPGPLTGYDPETATVAGA